MVRYFYEDLLMAGVVRAGGIIKNFMDFQTGLKLLLLALGLLLGRIFVAQRATLRAEISDFVFRWLMPYVVFMEVASIDLPQFWYGFVAAGAFFVLVPFFMARFVLRMSLHRSAILATAEGGTLGFAIYMTLGGAPIGQFFLVDQLGNGLALFLVLSPFLMQGRRDWGQAFNRITIAMLSALLLNLLFHFHPLQAWPLVASAERWLVFTLVFSISLIVGSGIRFAVSRDIFFSAFFRGFWVYRLGMVALSFWWRWPLALTILFLLPPSFLLPILLREQRTASDQILYVENFIAACLPLTLLCALGLLFI